MIKTKIKILFTMVNVFYRMKSGAIPFHGIRIILSLIKKPTLI